MTKGLSVGALPCAPSVLGAKGLVIIVLFLFGPLCFPNTYCSKAILKESVCDMFNEDFFFQGMCNSIYVLEGKICLWGHAVPPQPFVTIRDSPSFCKCSPPA